MKDNSKRITISLTTSTWSHCFVSIEQVSITRSCCGGMQVKTPFDMFTIALC